MVDGFQYHCSKSGTVVNDGTSGPKVKFTNTRKTRKKWCRPNIYIYIFISIYTVYICGSLSKVILPCQLSKIQQWINHQVLPGVDM